MDLEQRENELEEIISSMKYLIATVSDSYYISYFEMLKDEAEEEYEEVTEKLNKQWLSERRSEEIDFQRMAVI